MKNLNPEAAFDYKQYQHKFTHVKEATKRLYFAKKFNDDACNNPSTAWKYINKVLRKTKTITASVKLINSNGQTITSAEEMRFGVSSSMWQLRNYWGHW